MGIQPAQMNIGHLAVGELEAEKHHILNPLLDIALAVSGDRSRFFFKEMKDYRQIMGSKGEEGVLVLADHTEIDPLSINIIDPPQLAGVDHLLQPVHDRLIDQKMAHHQNSSPFPSQL